MNSPSSCRMILAVLIFLLTLPALARDPAPPLAAVEGRFAPDKSTLVLGEPVWITLRLVNHSAAPVHFIEAVNRGSLFHNEYLFAVRNAAGHEVGPALPRAISINGMVHDVAIVPGETFQQRLFLPDWFTFRRPGSYTLTYKRAFQFFRSPPFERSGGPRESGPIVRVVTTIPVRVLPANVAALGVIIHKLGEQTLSPDGAARDEAAMSLSVIPDPRIVPILVELLSRSDPPGGFNNPDGYFTEDSKCFAIAGLSQFPGNASAGALLTVLNQNDEDLRRAVGAALRKMRYADRVIPPLRRELKSPSASVRVAAIHALGATQDVRAFAPLVNALHDREADVRYEAASALGMLRDRRAEPILKSHLRDPDMTLRLACIKGLVPLKFPVLTQWLVPIIRSYAYPAHQHPSLEAMSVMRLECGNRAAPALASCLQFNDPRPSNGYNYFLIYNLQACSSGQPSCAAWVNGNDDQPDAVENNRKILSAIKTWLSTQSGF